jgi:hypothetical protein
VAPRSHAAAKPGPTGGGRRYAVLGAFGLLVVVGAVLIVLRLASPPSIESLVPQRIRVGQTLVITGHGFDPSPQGNAVLFGERRANVISASSSRLEVAVPAFPLLVGRGSQAGVTVQVAGRSSASVPIALYEAPRIDGLSRDVAMPGEEIELAGAGWNSGAVVRFGSVPGEIISNAPNTLRVRVPPLDGPSGTQFGVVVVAEHEESNTAPFFIGKLPLVTNVDPRSAAPGDPVTVSGRGFRVKPGANLVRVGGVRALVASASDTELKLIVPWLGSFGDVTVEVREPGLENMAEARLTVPAPAGDVVDFRFVVEALPVEDSPDHDHAVLATELGPAFVLSATAGQSAAERALEAARRLNAAAGPLKASLDADLALQGGRLALLGRPETILEATAEDAQGYAEDWTRAGTRGRPPTSGRLALWWSAVARDLVLLLVRGEKPLHAEALAPEGRVLGEIYQAARKTGRFGVPRAVLAAMKPPLRDQLRPMALRLPAAVPEAPSGEGGTGAALPVLQLQGVWRGAENVRGERNYVTVTFKGRGGTAAYGTPALTMDLQNVEQPAKDAVRFSLPIRGARYYSGTWDGRKVAGQVFADASGKNPIGTFELIPGQ